MAFEREQREALTLLRDLESGALRGDAAAHRLGSVDPALIHFIFTWLRHRYGGDHPAAAGVIGRLVEITQGNNRVEALIREGRADPVVAWFEEAHEYRDLRAEEFIELIVEKLEG